jgi:hypothetical protein
VHCSTDLAVTLSPKTTDSSPVSVLAEALSVIVRRSTLETKYPGGVEGYRRDCPNATFCADKHLTRIAFMVPPDVQRWIDHLTRAGLIFVVNKQAVDFVVVDQRQGPTVPCSWIEGGRHPDGYSAVWLAGTIPGELEHPPRWTPAQSKSLGFISNAEVAERVLAIGRVGSTDVFLDFKTGKEVYVGRVLETPALRHDAADGGLD